MSKLTPLCLCLTITLLTGCSSPTSIGPLPVQPMAQVKAPFAEGAITLTVQTDPDLNALQGIANSCTLIIVQAEKSSTLNKLLSNPAALKGLFSAAGAQDKILKVDRYAAMPGQSTTLHIDRSENTRYVAIVAGYYPFPKKQHMAIFAIPTEPESRGWWRPARIAELLPLSLRVRLGSSGISDFSGASQEPISLTYNDIEPEKTGG